MFLISLYIYIYAYFRGLQHSNKLRLLQGFSADSASLPPSAPVEVDKTTSEKLQVCLGQQGFVALNQNYEATLCFSN